MKNNEKFESFKHSFNNTYKNNSNFLQNSRKINFNNSKHWIDTFLYFIINSSN